MTGFSILRKKIFQLLEGDIYESSPARHINSLLIALILLNVVAVILESDKEINQNYAILFSLFETFSVSVFSIEYLIRVWSCIEKHDFKHNTPLKKRLYYMISPIAIVDLIAIAPFYISFFIVMDLRYLRLLRVLRLLKLTHYFNDFNIFLTVLVKELKNIAAAIMVMMFLIIIAASLMYALESEAQPEVFGNILHSFWWAVVTMTTVGYGDVIPETTLGKVIATIIMLIGVALVALPTAILAAGFSEELRERKRNLNARVKDVLSDGIIDSQEYRDLKEITEKLELTPEDLKHTIAFLKKNSQGKRCPHCGKSLLHKENKD
jgi:voltage-gated potassium channel